MDERVLVRSVLDDSDEDRPRPVFADWMENRDSSVELGRSVLSASGIVGERAIQATGSRISA